MLKPCPECHKKVSDQAVACPHCGYPLKARQNRCMQKHRKSICGFQMDLARSQRFKMRVLGVHFV